MPEKLMRIMDKLQHSKFCIASLCICNLDSARKEAKRICEELQQTLLITNELLNERQDVLKGIELFEQDLGVTKRKNHDNL